MRLVDLEPRWFDVSGVGGAIDGVTFLCPCAWCIANPGKRVRLGIQFTPIGQDRVVAAMTLEEKLRHVHELGTFDVPPGIIWTRTGETFDTLTLTPSVDASASGHWHGFITNGEIR
jgi:hypothetical protein